MPYITKNSSKAKTKMFTLPNDFLSNNKTEGKRTVLVKQRNHCFSLLKKAEKRYCCNLDEKKFDDNRKFWKTVKPLPSGKLLYEKIINLPENGKILKTNMETAKVSNASFSNFVQNLKISLCLDFDSLVQNIKPSMKTILIWALWK